MLQLYGLIPDNFFSAFGSLITYLEKKKRHALECASGCTSMDLQRLDHWRNGCSGYARNRLELIFKIKFESLNLCIQHIQDFHSIVSSPNFKASHVSEFVNRAFTASISLWILLHYPATLARIPRPAHFRRSSFYAFLGQLTDRDKRLAVAFNSGAVN